MWVRNLRLGLAAIFLLMSALLFLREAAFPEFAAKFPDWRLTVGAWLALVLAGWNAARWYTDWSAYRARAGANPLAVRTIKPEAEPNPEFDFSTTDRNPPRPSTNGDQR